ncbi:MAG: TauD/TfdA family dioxygenase [Alphaproteobacteria bacterium]|nr:TauD/TfdA family dioxygenase [Alphaproteobacteria bacterium]
MIASAPRRAAIEVRPVAGALGAEIAGVDLSRKLDDATIDAVIAAFHEHLVLFFRGQRLTPEQQVAFTRLFGPPMETPFVEAMEGYPFIVKVLKEADERNVSTFGNAWHSDFSSLAEPPLGSILYALEVPEYGGDTLFANMYAAYEALSPGMRRMLDGLRAIHVGKPYGTKYGPGKELRTSRSIGIERNRPEADLEVSHPVVRTHPETGRKALFVNAIYTLRFADMTEAESRPLLDYLYQHVTRPEFTCRFRWTPGALALWDNRATLHYAVNDYDGSRRLLHRTMIAGTRPV